MTQKILKIVFFSDLHYSAEKNKFCPERSGEYGISLLSRLVGKINEEIRPDLVLCGGDLINDALAENAVRMTSAIADIMALIHAPCLTIRGNHDLPQKIFTKYFPFRDTFDLDFLRIVSFDDPETPGCCAVRTQEDIRKMKDAAAGWNGILFSFQHTPLTPVCECPFNYDNTPELLACMRSHHYRGTLSGHFHPGMALREEDGFQFFVQSALCETPFRFSVLNMDLCGILSVESGNIELDIGV